MALKNAAVGKLQMSVCVFQPFALDKLKSNEKHKYSKKISPPFM